MNLAEFFRLYKVRSFSQKAIIIILTAIFSVVVANIIIFFGWMNEPLSIENKILLNFVSIAVAMVLVSLAVSRE